MSKFKYFIKTLMEYFDVDIQNMNGYKKKAENLQNQLQEGLKVVAPIHFAEMNQNLAGITKNIEYLKDRIRTATNFKTIFKKIFSDQKITKDISNLLKD